MKNSVHLRLFNKLIFSELTLPLVTNNIAAGFPSPAGDFIEQGIDLNQELIEHPAATFYAFVEGDSMVNAGIYDGDLLVVDKSIEYKDQQIVVCCVDGEFTVKRLDVTKGRIRLMPENEKFQPIEFVEGTNVAIWGVVSYSIKPHYKPFPQRKIICTR